MLVFPSVSRFIYGNRVKFLSRNVILLLMGRCKVELPNNSSDEEIMRISHNLKLAEIPHAAYKKKN